MRTFITYPRYVRASKVVDDFRAKTNEMFHSWDNYTPQDIEQIARDEIKHTAYEVNWLSPAEFKIVDVILTGSRSRGLERKRSDIDVVVEYTGSMREDDAFDMFARRRIYIGGHRLDINPIRAEDSGTLDAYLPRAEEYLENKARSK